MVYRKATLRRMPPVTRKYARLLGRLDSVLRKGKNLVEEIARLELDSRALATARSTSDKTAEHISQQELKKETHALFEEEN